MLVSLNSTLCQLGAGTESKAAMRPDCQASCLLNHLNATSYDATVQVGQCKQTIPERDKSISVAILALKKPAQPFSSCEVVNLNVQAVLQGLLLFASQLEFILLRRQQVC